MPEEKIKVDGAAIRDFAKTVRSWADELPELSRQVLKINVQPGDDGFFPTAAWLRGEVHKSRDAVGTNLTNLRNALFEISTDLNAIVDQYARTEDLNKLDADKIKGLVDDVNKHLPGVGGAAVPPAPPTNPPATPPPPAA